MLTVLKVEDKNKINEYCKICHIVYNEDIKAYAAESNEGFCGCALYCFNGDLVEIIAVKADEKGIFDGLLRAVLNSVLLNMKDASVRFGQGVCKDWLYTLGYCEQGKDAIESVEGFFSSGGCCQKG